LINLKGRDNFEDLNTDKSIILKWNLKKQGAGMWTKFIWFRTGTTGELL
jgi:hypothetical protein